MTFRNIFSYTVLLFRELLLFGYKDTEPPGANKYVCDKNLAARGPHVDGRIYVCGPREFSNTFNYALPLE
jgi:hypothetical protein